jgi:hypothetical protein
VRPPARTVTQDTISKNQFTVRGQPAACPTIPRTNATNPVQSTVRAIAHSFQAIRECLGHAMSEARTTMAAFGRSAAATPQIVTLRDDADESISVHYGKCRRRGDAR